MMPRVKWNGPKKRVKVKKEPGVEDNDDSNEDSTYSPVSKRLHRVAKNTRVSKRYRSTETPHIKREPGIEAEEKIKKPFAKAGNRRKVKNVDEIEVEMRDETTGHRILVFVARTEPVKDLLDLWKEKRHGISEPRFFFDGERIVDGDSTIEEVCQSSSQVAVTY